jgi:hypothetical protein
VQKVLTDCNARGLKPEPYSEEKFLKLTKKAKQKCIEKKEKNMNKGDIAIFDMFV